METKNTSSSGSVLEEPEIQKLQIQAKIFKENFLNKLNALKSTTQLLERQNSAVKVQSSIIGSKSGDETSSGDCIMMKKIEKKELEAHYRFHGKIQEVLLQNQFMIAIGTGQQNELENVKRDPTIRFCPNGEETVTLEKESRSKLDKDKVKPYDYTYQNSLYETFKPPSKTYLDQLEHAKEVRKTMWRKMFNRTKPNIAKNVSFLPVSKSISKSRQVYNEMTNNFNHFRKICEQAWSNHTNSAFPNPTAKTMEVLIKMLLMPLSNKTILDSHCFVHELEMRKRDVLERERRERDERKEKRYFLDILNNLLFQVEKFLIYPDT
ncbi:hypothetical protein Tco_0032129 [Tanacetum coccineum]